MKITLIINAPIRYCPRALRLYNKYKDKHQIIIIDSKLLANRGGFFAKVNNILLLLTGQFNQYLSNLNRVSKNIDENKTDLVIVYDLILLKFAIDNLGYKKLAIDLREYYPLQFENNLLWRLTFSKLFVYICDHYLPKANLWTTVSHGIADLYRTNYHITPTVKYSLPLYHDLMPSDIIPDSIKLVHHGVTNPNRGLENMINAMELLGDKYILTLYLVNNNNKYYNKLIQLAKAHDNVKILQPLKFDEIITTINQHDIGLFCPPNSTTNLKFSMPNKLFEYVQARLAIVTSPLLESKQFVETNKLGAVLQHSSSKEIYSIISQLKTSEIQYYKEHAAIASKIFRIS